MQQLITAISIILFCTEAALAQQPFDMRLMEIEQQIYNTEDSLLKNQLVLRKMDVYMQADSINARLLQEVRRVDAELLPDSLKTAFYWNAMLISFLNEETYLTLHYLEAYEAREVDSTMGFLALKHLTYLNYDTTVARGLYNYLVSADSSLQCLDCIAEVERFELKHKKLITNAAFVPGLGMILNGNIGRGMVSIALNTATVLAIVYMAKSNLIINALGWGTNLAGKFYLGNIRLTSKLVERKESGKKSKLAQACELKIQQVFNKYPVAFR